MLPDTNDLVIDFDVGHTKSRAALMSGTSLYMTTFWTEVVPWAMTPEPSFEENKKVAHLKELASMADVGLTNDITNMSGEDYIDYLMSKVVV